MLQILFTTIFLLFLVFETSSEKTKTVFLTEDETYLVFPHREFSQSTYSVTCKISKSSSFRQHKEFQTISQLKFKNECQDLDFFQNLNSKESEFMFAKIDQKKLCGVYKVANNQINRVFQYSLNKHYQNVMIINQTTIFVWNQKEIVKIMYDPKTSKINKQKAIFKIPGKRKCKRNKVSTLLCWTEKYLSLVTFEQYLEIKTFESDFGKINLAMFISQNLITICGDTEINCSIASIVENKLFVEQNVIFQENPLGGTVNTESNKIVTVSIGKVTIRTYAFYDQVNFTIQEQVYFPDQFQCIQFSRASVLSDKIFVECFNYLGDIQHIVFVKDKWIDRYIPFNPTITSTKAKSWVTLNSKYLFNVFEDKMEIKQMNFYFVEISNDFEVDYEYAQLQCSQKGEESQKYILEMKQAKMQEKYVNQQIKLNKEEIIYSDPDLVYLKDAFKANMIQAYQFRSNCSFIQPFNYSVNQETQYFSLYNREKCVQIIGIFQQCFYRLLEINVSLFYLQKCLFIKPAYVCELEEIIDHVGVVIHFEKTTKMKIKSTDPKDHGILVIFYIQNQGVVMEKNGNRVVILEGNVIFLEKRDSFLRITTDQTYYFASLQKLAQDEIYWRQQLNKNLYFKEQMPNFPEHDNKIILPYTIKRNDYIFTVGTTTITKTYSSYERIKYFDMPFNSQNLNISHISLVGRYLTIQYQNRIFQIFDMDQEIVSSKIAAEAKPIMTDIFLVNQDTIIVPIESNTSLIKIERNPSAELGFLPPQYSKFQEVCTFYVTLKTKNGSCINDSTCSEDDDQFWGEQDLSQQFSMKIKYYVEEIDLDNSQVQLLYQPDKCQNCIFKLKQEEFFGHIFKYQLVNDYYEQFVLIPHLTVNQCSHFEKDILKGMFQIVSHKIEAKKEAITMNGSSIFFLGLDMNISSQFPMRNTDFCSVYLKIQGLYLFFCDRYFLLSDGKQINNTSFHSLKVSIETKDNYQIQYDSLNETDVVVFVLVNGIFINIYHLVLKQPKIEYVNNFSFKSQVQDMRIVEDRAIIIHDDCLCVLESQSKGGMLFHGRMISNSFNLSSIIPPQYSSTFIYKNFVPYFSSSEMVKGILFSQQISNLHIDIKISLATKQYNIEILNAYATYMGYSLIEVKSINITGDSYSYFIVEMIDYSQLQGRVVGYYQYNSRFLKDKTIGTLRGAEVLSEYFYDTAHINFISFKSVIYVQQNYNFIMRRKQVNGSKTCVRFKVKDQLEILMNYQQAPPLKFLILEARNQKFDEKNIHFIRINFIPDNNILWPSLLCLAVTIFLFVFLIFATNGCKNSEQDIQAPLLPNQNINDMKKDLSNEESSLLYSKDSSDISGRKLSQNSSEEIVIIKEYEK